KELELFETGVKTEVAANPGIRRHSHRFVADALEQRGNRYAAIRKLLRLLRRAQHKCIRIHVVRRRIKPGEQSRNGSRRPIRSGDSAGKLNRISCKRVDI